MTRRSTRKEESMLTCLRSMHVVVTGRRAMVRDVIASLAEPRAA